MSNALTTGTAWLDGQRHQHMVGDVTIHRGAEAVACKATKGKSPMEAVSESGVVVKSESVDFLMRSADYMFGTPPVVSRPQVGDKISEVVAGKTLSYEVLNSNNEAQYRFSDPLRTTLRIHTQLVAET